VYTHCPHCQESFRITAEILQQAGGRVRCGACGRVFNALDGLSETPAGAGQEQPGRTVGDESLRATFEELEAFEDVRLEDTGVEWRLVEEDQDAGSAGDDDAAASSALLWYIHEETEPPPNDARIPETSADLTGAGGPALEIETPTATEERYDDNTPLPGLLDGDETEEEEEAEAIFAAVAQTPADDLTAPRTEPDEPEADLALGEPEEWTDLLEEVADVDAPAAADEPHAARPGEHTAEADEEPTAEHPVLEAPAPPEAEGAGPEPVAPPDEGFDVGDLALEEELVLEEADAPAALAGADGDAGEAAGDDEATGEFESLGPAARLPAKAGATLDRQIDEDLLRASGSGLVPPSSPGPQAPPHVETIVMEGEIVRSSLHGELVVPVPADDDTSEPAVPAAGPRIRSLRDTYLRLREVLPAAGEADRPTRRWRELAAALLLGLLLAAQIVHAHRETLATWPLFDATLGTLYASLGAPITPDWDVNAWQFLSTSGNTDANDRILTISSSITNRSERALPYPLLHVSLTDRYEEIVASGLLEPAQYLDIRSAEGMVDAGDGISATITIAPLDENATGYTLNVCYPLQGARVRCATGAFRKD
jgi:predicted Zn finger-like uncharacterized protein